MSKYFVRFGLLLSVLLITYDVAGQHGWSINPSDYKFNGEVVAVVLDGTDKLTTGTLGAFIRDSCRGYSDGIVFPPTGETVFIVMCYSYRAEGDTITFKYFNPSDNSTRNLVETVIFEEDMTVGNAESPEELHICYPVSIVSQPADAGMCAGSGNASFSVVTAGSPVFDYQWQYYNGSEWIAVVNGAPSGAVYTNANTTTLGISGITSAGNYRYRCYITNCNAYSYDISDEVTLTVFPVSVGGTISGSITVCSGTNNTTLTLSDYVGAITKWQSSVSPFTVWTDISNTNATYTATNLTVTTRYRAVVSSGVCPSVNSGEATITVSPNSVGGTISGSTIVCSGTNSTTMTLSGYVGAITKWQSSVSPFTVWTDISNTNATYTATNLTVTTRYRAVVSSGVCPSVNSGEATITVSPNSVGGTISGSTIVCSGTNSTTMTLSGYVGAITKWQSSVSPFTVWTDISNTNATYTATDLTVTTRYRAVVSSGVCPSVNSGEATITVSPNSVGGTISGSAAVCSGTNSTTLTLSGYVGAITKWQSSVSPFTVWTDISNTNATYTATDLTVTTRYRAVVSSGVCPSVNSGEATITVNQLPVPVITGPSPVCTGITGNIYSTQTGMSNYSWSITGGIITSGGTSTDNTATVTWTTAGTRSISVNYSNLNGCIATSPTIYSVLVNQSPTAITGSAYISAGLTTALGSTPAGGSWASSNTGVATINLLTGLVTGMSQGTTIITYELPATCSVSTAFDVLPAGWNSSTGYTYNNLVTAKVFIGGTPVESGYLAAFAGDECRGVATSTYYAPSDHYVFSLNCFSDKTKGDVLVFKYYDPVANTVYNMDRSVDFVPGVNTGTPVSPFIMNVGVEYSLSLPVGWTWLSLNNTLDNMSLNFILSSVNSPGNYIKSQVNTATYYAGYGWFGPLNELNPLSLYKLKVQNSSDINFSGRPVNVNSTTIPVVSGWNWIGFLPQSSQLITTAFSSLNLAHLDYIKNQFNTATWYSGYGWYGQLETLSPKVGYMLKLSNPGTIKYSESGKSETLAFPSSKGSELDFDPYSFEYNGSMTAKVMLNGATVGSEDDILYAYAGDEIRGVAAGQLFAPTNTWLYTLMIYSNTNTGEIINLGFYDSQTDEYLECEETVTFKSDMVLNNALNPFIVNIDASSVNVTEHNYDDLSLQVYPNPFETSLDLKYNLEQAVQIRISVYDIYGRMLKILVDQKQDPGTYVQKWYPGLLSGGTYFIKIQAGKRQIYRKVMFNR